MQFIETQQQNVADTYTSAVNYLNNPSGPLEKLDLYPRSGVLKGTAIDTHGFSTFSDWNRDFNGRTQDESWRGAYSGEGSNPGWSLKLDRKP